MRVEVMAEAYGADVYVAGDVHAGSVDLAEVRSGGPHGALIGALDEESRNDLADALFECAAYEDDEMRHGRGTEL